MNLNKLPEECFIVLPSTDELVMVKRGVMGYFPQRPENAPWEADVLDHVNERLGVTKAQAEAMRHGSMLGWDNKLADPDNYDEDGNFIK